MLINDLTTHTFTQFLFEEPSDKGGNKKKEKKREPLSEEFIESLKSLIDKNGGNEETAKILYKDNFDLREKIRGLEERVLEEGQVAVDKSDLEILEAVKEIGTPDEVKKQLKDLKEGLQKIADFETKQKNTTIADAYGYNADVLSDLLKDLEVETSKEKDGDKEVLKAKVKVDDTKMDLKEWIDTHKSVYIPALEANSESDGGKRITRQTSKNGNEQTDNDLVEQFRKRNESRADAGNALSPKKEEQKT